MITSLVNGATNAPPTSTSTQTNSLAANSGTDALANEQTFLKLLVAQMQNQDPTQPQDGTQFVTQLAQFSSLEQQIAMRQDLDAMSKPVVNSQTGGTQAARQQ
jgi:flagellar basal-body rod modification protein FlgD